MARRALFSAVALFNAIDRQQLLRGLLGGPTEGIEGRAAYTEVDKIIRIIDGFSIGH